MSKIDNVFYNIVNNDSLTRSGLEVNNYSKNGKAKIYINDSCKIFTQYIDERDGKLALKVFLASKKFEDIYSKDEYKQCFDRRTELVQQLNKSDIGVSFDSSTGGEAA